jgi:hypothetical protein
MTLALSLNVPCSRSDMLLISARIPSGLTCLISPPNTMSMPSS